MSIATTLFNSLPCQIFIEPKEFNGFSCSGCASIENGSDAFLESGFS